MKLALVLLAFWQFIRPTDPPTTRELHFAGGIAIVERQGDREHVVIEDPNGIVQSDSYCDAQSGKYDDIVKLGEKVRTAAAFGDKALMASLGTYPLHVNLASTDAKGARAVKERSVLSQGELVSYYSTYITYNMSQQLRFMEPHDVFCRNGMSLLAGGLVWATADRDGNVKIAIINQP